MISSTFNHQLNQCINDISRCVASCEEIRRKRNLGKEHHHKTTQLDELERSLQAGSGFILGEAGKYPRLSTNNATEPEEICNSQGSEFAGYISQIEDLNLCLQAIADPPSHDHHHPHHHHLSHVLFPGWDWDVHHTHAEHPHFYEMRMQWEKIRDGIPRAFAEMDIQAALQDRLRTRRKEDEDQLKADKKKLKDKLDKIEKEEKEELEDSKKTDKKELKSLKEHNEEKLLEQERIEHKRDLAVERLVETKLEDDPIDQMDKLVHVVGHIQRAFSPRTSHETIRPIRFNLNSSAVASGYGLGAGGRGGRGGSANPEVVIDDRYHRSHSHYHPRHHHTHPIRARSCPSFSDSDSTEASSIHHTPVLIENTINNHNAGENESVDDEATIIGGRGIVRRRYHHGDDWYGHGRRRDQRYLEASRHHQEGFVTLTVPESEADELEEFVERRHRP